MWSQPADDDRTVLVIAAPQTDVVATRDRDRYPKRLLDGCQWVLPTDDLRTPTLAWVREEVGKSGPEVLAALGKTVLSAREVRVLFEPWDDAKADRVTDAVTLYAHRPEGFTGIELVHALHVAVAESLQATGRRLGDHCFLEHLDLSEESDDLLTYWASLGS